MLQLNRIVLASSLPSPGTTGTCSSNTSSYNYSGSSSSDFHSHDPHQGQAHTCKNCLASCADVISSPKLSCRILNQNSPCGVPARCVLKMLVMGLLLNIQSLSGMPRGQTDVIHLVFFRSRIPRAQLMFIRCFTELSTRIEFLIKPLHSTILFTNQL